MNKETAREEIRYKEPDFLIQAKKKVHNRLTYVCPICENGTGKDGDGITFDPKVEYPHWKCYKCGLYEDIIGLWKAHTSCTDDSEVFKTLYEYYGITIDETTSHDNAPNRMTAISTSNTAQNATQTSETDYSNFFLQANQNLTRTSYHRGIGIDTLNQFNVGYIEHWRHPKAPLTVPTSPRLIIPTSNYSYLARDTRENLTATQKKYSKSKVGTINEQLKKMHKK